MLRRRASEGSITTRNWVGAALLFAASASAFPIARWGDSALVLLVVPAAIAGYRAGRRMTSLAVAVITIAATLLLALPASLLLPGGAPLGDWIVTLVIAVLVVVGPWWGGRYRLLRAEQRERDAAALASRAQAAERARIADDLHDTLGHELALIAVQAGSLELDAALDERQRARFSELRGAAVRASEQLRDVVDLTRVEATRSLEPTERELADIVARSRQAGMSVQAIGLESDDVPPPPFVRDLLVRALREGLTNAAKHAPGAPVHVAVGEESQGWVLRVTNQPPLDPDAAPGDGSGHGIPSLRQRATSVGGSVDASRTPEGGFALIVRVPRTPAPPDAPAHEAELQSSAAQARRRILQSAMVPGALAGLVLVAFLVVQAVTVAQTALPSGVYDDIELGASRGDLAGVLPAGVPSPPPVVDEPAAPAGAECEYFAARDGWLHFTEATYRLCFADGELVEKLELGGT